MQTDKPYTDEFKRSVVEHWLESGKSARKVAEEFGIKQYCVGSKNLVQNSRKVRSASPHDSDRSTNRRRIRMTVPILSVPEFPIVFVTKKNLQNRPEIITAKAPFGLFRSELRANLRRSSTQHVYHSI